MLVNFKIILGKRNNLTVRKNISAKRGSISEKYFKIMIHMSIQL